MCFKNEVTFSFEAMEDLAEDKFYNPESRRDIGIDGIGLINTVNGIYGKNASGKSTLLRAIATLYNALNYTYTNAGGFSGGLMQLLNPILRGSKAYSENLPIKFKGKFANPEAQLTYIYEIHIKSNDQSIVKETLTQGEHLIFDRPTHLEEGTYNCFDETEINLLFKHIRTQQPILSSNILTNLDSVKDFYKNRQPAFIDLSDSHYRGSVTSSYTRQNFMMGSYIASLLENPIIKPFILEELRMADFTIENYSIHKFPFEEEDKEEGDDYLLYFHHKNKTLSFFEESLGTQKYFFLLLEAFIALEQGKLLVIDELEKALHPLLARRFINLFKNPETNPKNARLLFSSHDMMFLHQSVLNGDQIWFIDRDDQDGTTLYSPAEYADFDPLHVQKDYTLGCYGAVPNTDWRG